MKYTVLFTEKALKGLKKLDKATALLITSWIRKNLSGCQDPRLFGKALKGDHKDKWSYRVGSYRLLSKIDQKEIIILILSVGHRKKVYR